MEQLLFIVSATILINWLFKMTGHLLFGNSMEVPAPLFRIIGWEFTNTDLVIYAISYQVCFWANYSGIFSE